MDSILSRDKSKEISHNTVKIALDIFNFKVSGSENRA